MYLIWTSPSPTTGLARGGIVTRTCACASVRALIPTRLPALKKGQSGVALSDNPDLAPPVQDPPRSGSCFLGNSWVTQPLLVRNGKSKLYRENDRGFTSKVSQPEVAARPPGRALMK